MLWISSNRAFRRQPGGCWRASFARVWEKNSPRRSAPRLPGSFLAPKPPNESQGGGILLLFQSPERVSQEVRMVGSVSAPLCPHQEPVRELLFESKRVFLDRLGRAGEEATAVGEILGPRGDGELRGELITGIGGSATCVRRRGSCQEPLDYVVAFQAEGELGCHLPGQVAVEDVQFPARRIRDRHERYSLCGGQTRSRIREKLYVRVLLPQVIVQRPGHVLVGRDVESEELILEAIEGLRLLSAIRDPIVQSDLVIELVVHTRAHMIERQEVKPIRARVVHLIFRVVALKS